MAEQLANRASTFLAEAMTNSQTSMKVTGAIGFPATPSFRVRIEDELMLVTAGGSSTVDWTVTRGVEGTTAASHVINKKVFGVLTRQALLNVVDDAITAAGGGSSGSIIGTSAYASLPSPGTTTVGTVELPTDEAALFRNDGTAWQPWGPIQPFQSMTLPSDFTDLDSGADDDSFFYRYRGSQYFYGGTQGAVDKLRMRAKTGTFTSPWNVTLGLIPLFAGDATGQEFGIFLRTTSSSKITTVGLRFDAGVVYGVYDTWTAFNTKDGSTPAVAKKLAYKGGPIYLRVNQDALNTARRFWYSVDGVFWVLITSQVTSYHTPDQYGVYLNPKNVSVTSGMKVLTLSKGVDATFELSYASLEPSYR